MTWRKEILESVFFPTKPFQLMNSLTIRTILGQAVLMLSLPVVITGFSDLSSVALCATRVLPFEAGIAFASGLTFLYTIATAISGLTIFLTTKDINSKDQSMTDNEKWGNEAQKGSNMQQSFMEQDR